VPLVAIAILDARAPSAATLVVVSLLGTAAVVSGELLERTLFFRAVSAPTMPGGISR
jgi:hypothetical protein